MNTQHTPRHQSVLVEGSLEEVFARVLPELEALRADELPIINVEIASAVTQTLGVLPGIVRYREAIQRELGEFNLERFDKLEIYAKALLHAQREHSIATEPPDELKSLFEESRDLRELLHHDATTLAARGFFSAATFDDLKGPNGYKNTALDLQLLVGVLRGNWKHIEGKCAVTKNELEYADQLALHLMRVYGLREQTSGGTARATDLRNRAYALFVRAYEDTRRAIHFLRWNEGDAEIIAPSLLASRSPAKKKPEEATTTPSESAPGEAASANGAALTEGAAHLDVRPSEPRSAELRSAESRSPTFMGAGGPFAS
jgi:hypothetical protein